MSAWLSLIGTGADGVAGLTPGAKALLEQAEIVIAPKRLQNSGDFGTSEVHNWTSPITGTLDKLATWRGRNVAILATGDPLHYGIGVTLLERFGLDEMRILPAPSAFSLAAARMGWAVQDAETLSLHGRPATRLQAFLQPGAKLLVLTSGAETITQAAEMMMARGFGPSAMTVLENMGGPDEKITDFAAADVDQHQFGAFHTLAIRCVAELNAAILPTTPGLPDDAYVHDGQLTKREVRAVTLSALAPAPGALLLDVGAGCGSIGIEWMRAARGAKAMAFERHPERLAMIAENASALGTPELDVVPGELPGTLQHQPTPSAIFLGGAVSDASVFEACWAALPIGGRMVANAVTLEGESAVAGYHKSYGGELVRMEVSRVEAVGTMRGMRPGMAVLQWRSVK
ncbi:MAG: precorrin-6y C5,15-methyltransferase (decarboxylating) subunit CbiE [Alphaproteobacteria bacterium]|nr:precorrin-6y C5,15-methyltransferase (decarboxylating) subunit CbiE [Alphaproteobacteria bacterium]